MQNEEIKSGSGVDTMLTVCRYSNYHGLQHSYRVRRIG